MNYTTMWYKLKSYLLKEERDGERKTGIGIGKYNAEEVLKFMNGMEIEEVMKNEWRKNTYSSKKKRTSKR